MLILFTIIHVLVCLFLIIVVLLQSGKAADLAGAFGGMGSQTAFGPRGAATVLTKATTVAAVLFMVTSLSLSILATRSGGGASTVLDQAKPMKKPDAPKPGGGIDPAQVPTMTLTPEGGDPSKSRVIQLPLPDPKGGGSVKIPMPGQDKPPAQQQSAPAPKPVEQKK